MQVEYVVVGSGLTGAVLARRLADSGREVVVVERRHHLGGNVVDHTHPSGIRVHTYGPHYFRTDSDVVWSFVNRFSEFYTYEASLKSLVDGQCESWPITSSYIRRTVGEGWKPAFIGSPANFEEASLAIMPRMIYDKFVKGYTEKQWGVPAAMLSAQLAKRFEVRQDGDPRLVRSRYQGLPVLGYTNLMTNMLADIPTVLNCNYLEHRETFTFGRKLIYTGPIDEYFGFDQGRLSYRGQKRSHSYLPDVEFHQGCCQVNNPDPDAGPHIRTLEWKHLMPPEFAKRIQGTVLTREVTVSPDDPNDYEYPFPDRTNDLLYQQYRERAKALRNVVFCGRLGEYRYYDMDQAIERALHIADELL